MFSEKAKTFADFSTYVKESLNKRALSLLTNEEFVDAASLGAIKEFQDDPDQLKPMLTPQELEKLLSHARFTVDGSKGYKVSSVEDIHDEVTDEEFHQLYMDEFGVEPWEDHDDEEEIDHMGDHASDHAVIDDYEADEMSEAYVVKFAKTKGGEIHQAAYDDREDAEKFLADMNKKGYKGIISIDKNVKVKNESVQYEGCYGMKDEDAAHFNTAAAKAHKAGQSHFEFGGKKYPVKIQKHHADTIHKETK